MANSKPTETELISINAALNERGIRLSYTEARLATGAGCACMNSHCMQCRDLASRSVLKTQIRDLETQKHALLQRLDFQAIDAEVERRQTEYEDRD